MPTKTQRSSANASRVASNKNKAPRETAAQRRAKGIYTKAELKRDKPKRGGDKKVTGVTESVTTKKSTTAKGNTTGLRKVKAKSSGKVATKTQGVVTKTAKGNTKGLKKVAVPKTKKQERKQARTQRKAKRAADARNKANKILKKTSGTGKKVTSRDQRKLKRLRGKYNRNTK